MAGNRRLIDANELPNGKFVKPRTEWHKGWNDALDAAMSQAPTVDAVEVVHGEWIMCEDENDCEYIECPLCGEQFYDGDNDTFDKPWNYCPNCGAKMDGDGNG